MKNIGLIYVRRYSYIIMYERRIIRINSNAKRPGGRVAERNEKTDAACGMRWLLRAFQFFRLIRVRVSQIAYTRAANTFDGLTRRDEATMRHTMT